MSYTVLAVKWRPRRFEDLVGQQHVVQALVNSLATERLHHAYLFSGTRGVGKTTVARILAKALNCEQGIVAEPCGVCAACQSIDQGRFVDLIEVDAASRTKVDDTRELLDNVQYAPARGRFKVYLIDEVHMLSNHSFNALLKTLEEPPPHVKFLLATTDPQKLPITVLSRCLQFNLKRLTPLQIQGQLEKICTAENVEAEAEGLKALAKAADGSVRDALSMLDQAIVFGGGAVRAELVTSMLGTIDRGHVLRILEALAAEDGGTLLDEVARLDERVPDYGALLEELMGALQQLAVIQLVGNRVPEEDLETLKGLAERIAPEDVQLYYQMAVQGRRDLPVSRDQRASVEMTLLRMLAFRPRAEPRGEEAAPQPAAAPGARMGGRGTAAAQADAGRRGAQRPTSERPAALRPAPERSTAQRSMSPPARPERAGPDPGTADRPNPADRPTGASRPESQRRSSDADMPPMPPMAPFEAMPYDAGPPPIGPDSAWDSDAGPTRSSGVIEDWAAVVEGAEVRGGARQLADHCELASASETRVELILAADKETLNTQQLRSRLEGAISQYLGRRITLAITPGKTPRPTPAERRAANESARMRRAREAMEQDPNVKAVQDAFGAVLEADSIQPVDESKRGSGR